MSGHLKLAKLLLGQLDLAWLVRVERVCQIAVAQTSQILVVQQLALAVVVVAARLVHDAPAFIWKVSTAVVKLAYALRKVVLVNQSARESFFSSEPTSFND